MTVQLTAAKRKGRKPTTQRMLALYAEQYDWGDAMEVVLSTPIKLVSEANQREHWSAKYKRKKDQQSLMELALPLAGKLLKGACIKTITLTRVGRKLMDADNSVASFKHVQDAIAKYLGADDGDLDWEYEQETDADGCVGFKVAFQLERQT